MTSNADATIEGFPMKKQIWNSLLAACLVATFTALSPGIASAQNGRPPYGRWEGTDVDGSIVTMVLVNGKFRLSAAGRSYTGILSDWETASNGGVLTVRYPESNPPNDRNRYYVDYSDYRATGRIVFGNQSFRVILRRLY
jgi:hypothetical protein